MKTPHSWNRLLSLALCLCMVLSMISGIPLTARGASGDSYELVTDVSQVLSGGQFVIVANKSGSAMALGTTISTKISAVAVTLSGNTVTGSNLPVWTVTATGSGIALNNGSKYLSYSSSTNFASASNAYEWSITTGSNGGFILNSASSARGIYYQISGNRFGAYATSNVSSSSYISELQLYKLASGGGSITVYFQNNWMWSDVTLHFWGSAGTADTQWPGKSMTLLGNNGSYDIYSLEIPSDITGLIINGNKSDNSGRDQTPDITSGWYNGIVYSMHWDNGNQVLTDDISNVGLPCTHKAETVPGKAPTCTETGLTEGSKCSLCGVTLKAQDTLPATGHSFSGETCKTCGSARYTTVYFRNNWKWSNVRLYFWGSTSDAEPTWPGNAAEYYGFDGEYDIYTMKVPNDATGFLVNGDKDDGSGLDKTPDITSGWFDGILYSMTWDNGNQVTTGKISDVGLQCAHKAQTVPGKAPTCTEEGLTEGSKCSLCGITLKAQESIPATGHTKQTVPGKAATCTATGLTDGVKCSVCGTVITAQMTIPTIPHSEQTIPGKAATCTATGLTEGSKCKTCGKVVKAQETIPTIPHSYKTDTCQVCGNPRYTTVYFRNNWKWTNVRLYYWESTSDAEALWPGKAAEYYGFDGEYDIYTMKVPNDATGFLINGDKDDGSGLDKTPDITSGWFDGILYSMTWDNGNQVTTGKISDVGLQCAHKAQTVPGKAPTCTEEGLTEGSKCSLCGATLKAQETIPATGHKLSNDKCTVCGYARYTTVYFRNNWKWSNVRLYYWESTTDAEALWPGKAAQYYGFDGEYEIYVIQVPNDATGFLVNGDKDDGSGIDKTPDITSGWFDGALYSMVYDNGNQVTIGNISDVELKCAHQEQILPAKDPTCTATGLTEGSKCSLCGEILKAQETIPATGHSKKTIAGKAPTCTEEGLSDGSKCKTCGEILKKQTVIPATGHTYSGDTCKVCGHVRYMNVYFRNNWLWTNIKLHFWGSTSDTNTDWPGAEMKYYGFDGTYEIYTMKVPTDIGGMTFTGIMNGSSDMDQSPDITEGWFDGALYSMEWDNGNQVSVGKIGDITLECNHAPETIPGKAPTCTDEGLTEGSKCTICGATLTAQNTIPATGHSYTGSSDTCNVCGAPRYTTIYFRNNWLWTNVSLYFWGSTSDAEPNWPGKAAQYYGFDGEYDIYTMKVPNDAFGIVITGNHAETSELDKTPDINGGWFDGILYAMAYDNGNQVTTGNISDVGLKCPHKEQTIPAKAPTCTETGLTEGTKCSLCGEILTAQETVPATGHTSKTLAAKAPTCTETGLTKGSKCKTCGEILKAQTVVPATGHSYTNDICKTCGTARYTTVYFRNNWKWSNVCLYYWGSTSDEEALWPGKAAEYYGFDGEYDIYVMKVPNDATGFLVNGDKDDGSGLDKTPDITEGWFNGILYSMTYDNGNQVTTGKISDIDFQCPHKEQTVPAKAPTCTETGLTEGSKCSLCGIVMKAQETVPATGHTPQTIPSKAATCTEEGLSEGSKCKTCGEILKQQTTVPATGHTFSGETCKVCGSEKYVIVYFRNNWMWTTIKIHYWGSSYDINPGWPGYAMEYYGFDGSYDIYSMKIPADIEGLIINGNKADGSGLDQTPDITEGWFNGIVYSMRWDNGNQVTTGKIGDIGLECPHVEKVIPGKEPTCTEPGLTEGTVCSRCGQTLTAQKTIPATGHSYNDDSCNNCGTPRYMNIYFRNNWLWTSITLHYWGSTSDGDTDWPGIAMNRFGYDGSYDIYTLKVPTDIVGMIITGYKDDGSGSDQTPGITQGWFDGIVYSMAYDNGNQVTTGKIGDIGLECPHQAEVIPAKAPTCTATGLTEGSKCSLCGLILTPQQSVPATGHKEKTIPGKDATCTEAGLSDGVQCTVCNKVLVSQVATPATGHRFSGTICDLCGISGFNTIYFRNNWMWNDITLYYWGSSIQNDPEWPGYSMEYYGYDGQYDIYTMKVPVDIEGMIFSGIMEDGSGRDQSCDIWEGWFNGALFTMSWDNGNQITIGKISDVGLQCPHETVSTPGKAPTCTEAGFTESSSCTICGAVLVPQEVIPATGHTYIGDICDECGIARYMHIYFRNNWSWNSVSLHFWGSTSDINTNWPGTAMTLFGYDGEYDIFVLKVPTDISGMRITGNAADGSGVDQTPELTGGWFDGIVYSMVWSDGNQVTTGKISDIGLKCPHEPERIPAKTPTCTKDGATAGSKCSLCGEILTQPEVLPAIGHTEQVLSAKAATCTEDGLTAGKKCSTCNTVLVAQKTIPATGHRYTGTTCEVCGAMGYYTVFFQNNWLWTDINLYYWGSSISEPEWPGLPMEYYGYDGQYDIYTMKIPVDIEGLIFNGNLADGSGQDQSNDIWEGWYNGALFSMVWDNGNHVNIGKINDITLQCRHEEEIIPGKDATCTEDGLTDGSKCTLCGATVTPQQTIPATGHSFANGSCTICGVKDPNFSDNTSYVLVTDLSQILSGGQFIIVANKNGTALALGTTISGKITPITVTLSGNTVVGSDLPVWILEATDNGIALFNGTSYLAYKSSTNFTASGTPYEWGVTAGSNGGFVFNSTSATRGLYYQLSGGRFGAYAQGNVGNSDYISGLQLYKLTDGSDTPVVPEVCPHTQQTVIPGKAATCTETGLTEGRKCAACGEILTAQNAIPATGHTKQTISGKAATCTADGLTDGTKCKTCGEILTAQKVIPATGHTKQTISGKAATCTEDGLTDGSKCKTCGEILTAQKVIPATGHHFTGNVCDWCGFSDSSSFITVYFQNNWLWTDIALYYWGSSILSAPEWPGVSMEYYKNDGTYDIYSLNIPADIEGILFSGMDSEGTYRDQSCDIIEGWFDGALFSMVWNNGNQVNIGKISDSTVPCNHVEQVIPGKAATCTETGLTDGSKCKTCGVVLTAQQVIPATGHHFTNHVCDRCGLRESSDYITVYFQNNWLWTDIALYYWGSSILSDPDWPGVSMEYYKNDGTYDIYSLNIPADVEGMLFSGMDSEGTYRDQSCDITEGWFDGALYSMVWDNGNHVLVGDINNIPTKPSKDLAFSGAGLTLYDDLTITFKADQSVIDLYTNVYAVFVLDGKTTIVRDFTLKDGKYSFPFRNIAPYRMNDTVTATLHGTFNGVEYTSETAQYSVATYCYNMLSKYSANSYAKFRTLLVDLLNYGAASQKYVSYNIGALVNANLTATQKAWATTTNRAWTSVQDLAYSTITSPSVQWKGGGLVLKESISMRFKISTSSIDGLKVKVVTKDGSEFIIDSFEPTNDGNYYFYFRELNAAQMSEAVTLTVYKGNTPVSNTVRYSIESYAYSQQNGSNTALVQLLQAMMKYGDAARSYVGK